MDDIDDVKRSERLGVEFNYARMRLCYEQEKYTEFESDSFNEQAKHELKMYENSPLGSRGVVTST